MNDSIQQPALHYLPIEQLEVDPEQPRRELEAPDEVNEARTLAGLAESIRQYGILQPLRVCAIDAHRFRIISGERRYRAALMAQLSEVPVMLIAHHSLEKSASPQLLLEQLTENVQRKAMTALELADAVHQLMGEGLLGRDIAKKLGIDAMQVSVLNKLHTVSEVIREAVTDRVIVSPRAAYDLNKLPVYQQAELINQARQKNQIIGQVDVKNARKAFAERPQYRPYQAPIMAKTEYAALMSVLNQDDLGDEHYDASADRLAILGTAAITNTEAVTGTNNNPPEVKYEEQSSKQNNDSFVSSLSTGEINSAAELTDQPLQHGSGSNESHPDVHPPINGSNNDRQLHSSADREALFRVPTFTLRATELDVIAEYLQEELPKGLADPGGWLVDVIKRLGRGR
ncbi:MAG: ParB/RepB/Spo0J family partition protein [Coriobacteriia bacterium]|nr:ParB/RepB/Spo0J family partition protein [Methylobacter sp.]MDP2429057.1 ParB/RepB/Spo0J family partition protein [Methylobacter sp.]MDP3055369.1 ParB/RepB/Spo0J family partition protein [Methylobacter sp.]MDP3361325.1 ParB/RepB/Spo0J family partition protein [Methylobacter sp.]MDZ4170303.1 ParB/RepB/Spo0J family partition protein [Coriobacteriia bacterium]